MADSRFIRNNIWLWLALHDSNPDVLFCPSLLSLRQIISRSLCSAGIPASCVFGYVCDKQCIAFMGERIGVAIYGCFSIV